MEGPVVHQVVHWELVSISPAKIEEFVVIIILRKRPQPIDCRQ